MRIWRKLLLSVVLTCLLSSFIGAYSAEAGQKIKWYKPYYDGSADLTLPDTEEINTCFDFKGHITGRYEGVLVNVVYGEEQVYYYYPVENNMVQGSVYLRFGAGLYQVKFNLVKPIVENSGTIEFDWLAEFEIKNNNTNTKDMRYLLPSWGIESNDRRVVEQANQITKEAEGDYLKAKAICEWVNANIEYDMEKYRQGRFYDNDGAVKTLENKKGLCRDFANLTTALLRGVGLEARTVIGRAGRGNVWYNHAWNEVKVEGKWISLDTVWGIFDQDPDEFNKTHIKEVNNY